MLTPLTLGAAALAQAYGIANPKDPISEPSAWALLDRCWSEGIRSIDTAAAYGDAEERIGRWATDRSLAPVIVSKSPPLGNIPDDAVASLLDRSIDDTRDRLRVATVDGYLLHRASDWRSPSVRAALRRARETGRVSSIGVSCYEADEAIVLLGIEAFDILQIPFSVFDRRAHESGLLDRAATMDVTVCARSVFLQGLLFLDPEQLAPGFRDAVPALARLRQIAGEAGCDLATLALQAVLRVDGIATVIVGLYGADQVGPTVASAAARLDPAVIEEAIKIAATIPADIRDPRLWRQD